MGSSRFYWVFLSFIVCFFIGLVGLPNDLTGNSIESREKSLNEIGSLEKQRRAIPGPCEGFYLFIYLFIYLFLLLCTRAKKNLDAITCQRKWKSVDVGHQSCVWAPSGRRTALSHSERSVVKSNERKKNAVKPSSRRFPTEWDVWKAEPDKDDTPPAPTPTSTLLYKKKTR